MERFGRRQSLITNGLAILAIGVFLAVWRSFSLLDPFFLIPFLCCAAVLVGPMVVAGFISYSDPLELLIHAVLRACASTLLALLIELLWLNYQWKGELLLPDGPIFFSALLLSLSLSTLGGIFILFSRNRMTATRATWIYRSMVVSAILIYIYFPKAWSNATTEFLIEHGTAQVILGVAVLITAVDAVLLMKLSHEET
jgi:hypothetical protein